MVFASVVFVYAGVCWSLLVSLVTSFQGLSVSAIQLPTVNRQISPQIHSSSASETRTFQVRKIWAVVTHTTENVQAQTQTSNLLGKPL